MRTQVCIIGGGPSGLLLSQLLHRKGIDSVVLERRSREYVLGRIRAGVLEPGTVALLREAGVGHRMDELGIADEGTVVAGENWGFRVDLKAITGKSMMVWGQTEITQDLYDARDAMEGTVIDEADAVKPHDVDTDTPYVTYYKDGAEHRIDCDWVAGCDGFHGVSRRTIPQDVLTEYERVYPFGWLGVLSETPPVSREILYASHSRGFALASLRNDNLSRYYVQVDKGEVVESWSDDAFWDEFRRRIPEEMADRLVTGPSVEKSIAPLRSYVAEPMRWGRLFLVGDAAHIVPPTGAKGLNLAVSDVYYLYHALVGHYLEGDDSGLETYAEQAARRVWGATRFSWWFTTLMHRYPEQSGFDRRMQETELDFLTRSEAAQAAFAEQYVGLPY
ncbi:4-hydroxybenzoate 3-monooxygenase [Psychromarinibacter sp. C21-152]|uniref:4-hydroxybenzoate 3-monooxygenase n=1 Tax=Psychromarinibacter sediminicola TaxID=3033385 RepID=A0AAE3TBZ9_9RHOB|nr:4-hydroxybenzoate 3-monooxygenase [Psychromarinibacter sediminicola]MDF0603130.1 4-hydroxybenzoate 3-monooxygenase [Psychromarinibacter sediminicola]